MTKRAGHAKNPYKVQIDIPGSKGILEKGEMRIHLGYYAMVEQVPLRRVAQYRTD